MSKILELKNKLNLDLATQDKNKTKYVKTKEQVIIKHSTDSKSFEEDNVYMSPTSASAKVLTADNNLESTNENIPVDSIYMSPTSVPKRMDMSKPLDNMLTEPVYMSPVSNQPKLPVKELQKTNNEGLNVEETSKDGHRNSFLIDMSELNMSDENDEKIFEIHEKPPPKLPAKSPSLPEILPIEDFQTGDILPPQPEENNTFAGDYEMSMTCSTYERDGYLAFNEGDAKSQIPIFITHRISDIKKTNSDKIKRIDRSSRGSNSSINSSKSVPASFPGFGSNKNLVKSFDLADEEDDTYYVPNDDDLEEFDRFSTTSSIGSNDSYNQPMEYDDETPPIPPPKTKSNLRKAKLKLLRQKLNTNIGSNYLSVNDHRSPIHQQQNDRKDWINGRPPSMPVSPPPTPPMEGSSEAQQPDTSVTLTEIRENNDVKFSDDLPPARPPKPPGLKPKPQLSNERIGNKQNNRHNYTQVVPKRTLPKQQKNKILNSSNSNDVNNVEKKSPLKTRNMSEVNIGIQTHANIINKRIKSAPSLSAIESSSTSSIQFPPLRTTPNASPTKSPVHTATHSTSQPQPVIPKKPDRFRIKKNLEDVMQKATPSSQQPTSPPSKNIVTKPTETSASPEHGTPTLKRKARPKVPPPPPPGVKRSNMPTPPNVPVKLNANQPPPPRKPAPTRPPPPSDDRIKEATLRRKQSKELNGISPETSDVYSNDIMVATETDTNPYSDIDFGEDHNPAASPIHDRFVIKSAPSPKKQPNNSKGKINRSFTAVANSMRSKLGKYRKNSKPETTSTITKQDSQELEQWVEEEAVYAGIDEHT